MSTLSKVHARGEGPEAMWTSVMELQRLLVVTPIPHLDPDSMTADALASLRALGYVLNSIEQTNPRFTAAMDRAYRAGLGGRLPLRVARLVRENQLPYLADYEMANGTRLDFADPSSKRAIILTECPPQPLWMDQSGHCAVVGWETHVISAKEFSTKSDGELLEALRGVDHRDAEGIISDAVLPGASPRSSEASENTVESDGPQLLQHRVSGVSTAPSNHSEGLIGAASVEQFNMAVPNACEAATVSNGSLVEAIRNSAGGLPGLLGVLKARETEFSDIDPFMAAIRRKNHLKRISPLRAVGGAVGARGAVETEIDWRIYEISRRRDRSGHTIVKATPGINSGQLKDLASFLDDGRVAAAGVFCDIVDALRKSPYRRRPTWPSPVCSTFVAECVARQGVSAEQKRIHVIPFFEWLATVNTEKPDHFDVQQCTRIVWAAAVVGVESQEVFKTFLDKIPLVAQMDAEERRGGQIRKRVVEACNRLQTVFLHIRSCDSNAFADFESRVNSELPLVLRKLNEVRKRPRRSPEQRRVVDCIRGMMHPDEIRKWTEEAVDEQTGLSIDFARRLSRQRPAVPRPRSSRADWLLRVGLTAKEIIRDRQGRSCDFIGARTRVPHVAFFLWEVRCLVGGAHMELIRVRSGGEWAGDGQSSDIGGSLANVSKPLRDPHNRFWRRTRRWNLRAYQLLRSRVRPNVLTPQFQARELRFSSANDFTR